MKLHILGLFVAFAAGFFASQYCPAFATVQPACRCQSGGECVCPKDKCKCDVFKSKCCGDQ